MLMLDVGDLPPKCCPHVEMLISEIGPKCCPHVENLKKNRRARSARPRCTETLLSRYMRTTMMFEIEWSPRSSAKALQRCPCLCALPGQCPWPPRAAGWRNHRRKWGDFVAFGVPFGWRFRRGFGRLRPRPVQMLKTKGLNVDNMLDVVFSPKCCFNMWHILRDP